MNNKFYKVNNKKRTALIWILIMTICISMLPMTAYAQDNDITEYVTFGDWNMYTSSSTIVKDGELVSAGSSLQAGQSITINYNWSISAENSVYITEGSYFIIDTNSKDFDFSKLGSVKIEDQDGTVVAILTAETGSESTLFKITFTAAGAEKQYYTDGWVKATGSVGSVTDGTKAISINGVSIPVTAASTSTQSSGFTWGTAYGTSFFAKSASYNVAENKVIYMMNVNTTNSVKYLEGEDVDTLENVRIEDILPSGVKIDSGSISMYGYLYMVKGSEVSPNAEAADPLKMSSQSMGDVFRVTSQFTKIVENDPAVDYETFKQNVENTEGPAYGIWQDKALYIKVGDMPGSLNLGITWGQMKQRIDEVYFAAKASDGTTFNAASDQIKQKTKEAYARLYGVPESSINNTTYDDEKGNVVGFILQFTTKVTGDDRDINNDANMYYGSSDSATGSAKVKFTNAAGGVSTGNPGDARLIILDGDTNEAIVGAEYKLQKLNYETNTYEDLTTDENGSGIFETGENGEILFENLDYGKYKIVEINSTEEYPNSATFKDGDGTFEITGDETGELVITAVNYKSDSQSSAAAIQQNEENNTGSAIENVTDSAIENVTDSAIEIITDSAVEPIADITPGGYNIIPDIIENNINNNIIEKNTNNDTITGSIDTDTTAENRDIDTASDNTNIYTTADNTSNDAVAENTSKSIKTSDSIDLYILIGLSLAALLTVAIVLKKRA